MPPYKDPFLSTYRSSDGSELSLTKVISTFESRVDLKLSRLWSGFSLWMTFGTLEILLWIPWNVRKGHFVKFGGNKLWDPIKIPSNTFAADQKMGFLTRIFWTFSSRWAGLLFFNCNILCSVCWHIQPTRWFDWLHWWAEWSPAGSNWHWGVMRENVQKLPSGNFDNPDELL